MFVTLLLVKPLKKSFFLPAQNPLAIISGLPDHNLSLVLAIFHMSMGLELMMRSFSLAVVTFHFQYSLLYLSFD